MDSGRTETQDTFTLKFLPEKYSAPENEDSPCELFVCTEKEKVRILIFAKAWKTQGSRREPVWKGRMASSLILPILWEKRMVSGKVFLQVIYSWKTMEHMAQV